MSRVDEDDATRSGRGGRATAAPGADDEHVAVGVHRVVPGHVRGRDEPPFAGGRLGDESVLNLDERRTDERPTADLDERVRLLLARAVHPTRAAAVQRPEAVEDAVADERGRQRLARAGPAFSPGEGESHASPCRVRRRTSAGSRGCAPTAPAARRAGCRARTGSAPTPRPPAPQDRPGRPRPPARRTRTPSPRGRRTTDTESAAFAAVFHAGCQAGASRVPVGCQTRARRVPVTGGGRHELPPHQWATAAAPCSSISAPVVNRSSEKDAFS